MPISKWATGPFDLLLHGEEHRISGDDFDRRIALISFDNAIEVAVVNYLTMNPAFRAGMSYKREDTAKWLDNYPSKLDFLAFELGRRKLAWVIPKEEILWVHEHRNEQYHGKDGGVPSLAVLATARSAAVWIFALLFNVHDIELEISAGLQDRKAKRGPGHRRDARFDKAIDDAYELVEVGDQIYYASQILYHVDPDAYRAVGLACLGENEDP